jgi:hypothetical protein
LQQALEVRRGWTLRLLFELAVADGDPALGARRDDRVVGDDEQRGAGSVQRGEQFGELVRGRGVQVAGRLVAQ